MTAATADSDALILVDGNDTEIGTAEKLDAHRRGLKHRAISVLIRNAEGALLLQRRALTKYHSGGLWTNACCSHPSPGETTANAAHRRLQQELGFACGLAPLFTFQYRENVPGDLIEDELVHVFGGRYDGAVAPDPAEVAEVKWLTHRELIADMRQRPDDYTIWFRHYMAHHGAMLEAWTKAP